MNTFRYYGADKGYNDMYDTYMKEIQELAPQLVEMEVKGIYGVRIDKP